MVKQEPKEKKISITLPVGKLLYDIILTELEQQEARLIAPCPLVR